MSEKRINSISTQELLAKISLRESSDKNIPEAFHVT